MGRKNYTRRTRKKEQQHKNKKKKTNSFTTRRQEEEKEKQTRMDENERKNTMWKDIWTWLTWFIVKIMTFPFELVYRLVMFISDCFRKVLEFIWSVLYWIMTVIVMFPVKALHKLLVIIAKGLQKIVMFQVKVLHKLYVIIAEGLQKTVQVLHKLFVTIAEGLQKIVMFPVKVLHKLFVTIAEGLQKAIRETWIYAALKFSAKYRIQRNNEYEDSTNIGHEESQIKEKLEYVNETKVNDDTKDTYIVITEPTENQKFQTNFNSTKIEVPVSKDILCENEPSMTETQYDQADANEIKLRSMENVQNQSKSSDEPITKRGQKQKRPKKTKWKNDYLNIPQTTTQKDDCKTVQVQFGNEPKGICNLGNTCYMNSVLQVLSWTPRLSDVLQQQMNSGMTKALFDLIQQTHQTKSRGTVNQTLPSNILQKARNINSQFNGYSQQDSYELFNTVISGIEDEQKPSMPGCDSDGPITKLFGGAFVIIYRYETCREAEAQVQKFTSIPTPIPQSLSLKKTDSKSGAGRGKPYPTTFNEMSKQLLPQTTVVNTTPKHVDDSENSERAGDYMSPLQNPIVIKNDRKAEEIYTQTQGNGSTSKIPTQLHSHDSTRDTKILEQENNKPLQDNGTSPENDKLLQDIMSTTQHLTQSQSNGLYQKILNQVQGNASLPGNPKPTQDNGSPSENGKSSQDNGSPSQNGKSSQDNGSPSQNGKSSQDNGSLSGNTKSSQNNGSPSENTEPSQDNESPSENGISSQYNGSPSQNTKSLQETLSTTENLNQSQSNETSFDILNLIDNASLAGNTKLTRDNGSPSENTKPSQDNESPSENGKTSQDNESPSENGKTSQDNESPSENGQSSQDNGSQSENGKSSQDNESPSENGKSSHDNESPSENGTSSQDNGSQSENGTSSQDNESPSENGKSSQDNESPSENGKSSHDNESPSENGTSSQDNGSQSENGTSSQDNGSPSENGKSSHDNESPSENGTSSQDNESPSENGKSSQDNESPSENGTSPQNNESPSENGKSSQDNESTSENGTSPQNNESPSENGQSSQDNESPSENGTSSQDNGSPSENGKSSQDNGSPSENGKSSQDDESTSENAKPSQDNGSPSENGKSSQDNGSPSENTKSLQETLSTTENLNQSQSNGTSLDISNPIDNASLPENTKLTQDNGSPPENTKLVLENFIPEHGDRPTLESHTQVQRKISRLENLTEEQRNGSSSENITQKRGNGSSPEKSTPIPDIVSFKEHFKMTPENGPAAKIHTPSHGKSLSCKTSTPKDGIVSPTKNLKPIQGNGYSLKHSFLERDEGSTTEIPIQKQENESHMENFMLLKDNDSQTENLKPLHIIPTPDLNNKSSSENTKQKLGCKLSHENPVPIQGIVLHTDNLKPTPGNETKSEIPKPSFGITVSSLGTPKPVPDNRSLPTNSNPSQNNEYFLENGSPRENIILTKDFSRSISPLVLRLKGGASNMNDKKDTKKTTDWDECFKTFSQLRDDPTELERGLLELTDIEEFQESVLSCRKCQKEGHLKTEKRLLILSLPPVLVLQINKFKQRWDGRLEKINVNVSYPKYLNMGPFCSSAVRLLEPEVDPEHGIWYCLYGVVSHSGSLHSGHYTAYIRTSNRESIDLPETTFQDSDVLVQNIEGWWQNSSRVPPPVRQKNHDSRQDKWFHVSDSWCSDCSEEVAIHDRNAYVLLYERITKNH